MTTEGVDDSLREAERIAALLEPEGVELVVIGAFALAAHRYVRSTHDVDLGVNADLAQMRRILKVLRSHGYDAEFNEPGRDDPLAGVIDVSGPFCMVRIVSFENRFPAVIRDALANGEIRTKPDGGLPVVPITQLVALKLYAGGLKSLADIVELLRRNPEADLQEIGDTCRKYRLRGWQSVMDELNEPPGHSP